MNPLPATTPRVTVRELQHGLSLCAEEAIGAGSLVLRMTGELRARPTRYTLQLDDDLHLDVPVGLSLAATAALHPWRFLDHSCAPNTCVREDRLVAVRDIAAGASITFDYNTTEARMAHPFDCGCGAADCVGTVAGFLHLDGAQRARREGLLLPHLRRRLYAAGAEG